VLPNAFLDVAHVVPDGVADVCARLLCLKGRVHQIHKEREVVRCLQQLAHLPESTVIPNPYTFKSSGVKSYACE